MDFFQCADVSLELDLHFIASGLSVFFDGCEPWRMADGKALKPGDVRLFCADPFRYFLLC